MQLYMAFIRLLLLHVVAWRRLGLGARFGSTLNSWAGSLCITIFIYVMAVLLYMSTMPTIAPESCLATGMVLPSLGPKGLGLITGWHDDLSASLSSCCSTHDRICHDYHVAKMSTIDIVYRYRVLHIAANLYIYVYGILIYIYLEMVLIACRCHHRW